nr:retrovirus-related Pol polyprotein from transposon TNT 1-94 [Tanacetum cinerariifolium]
MESSSDSDQEINANMFFMAQIEKVLSDSKASSSSADENISEVSYYLSESECESEFKTSEYYDSSTNYGLFVNNDDDQEIFHDAIESASENFIENHIDSQKDYDKSDVDHNDSEEKDHLVDKLIQKFNHKIAKSLEIEKFKRSRKNKIEFAYDYENLNASYVNEKINLEDVYFQEIINPDFDKIDSPFQQTSSLKPYVPNVILEKIIIDLEDEVVNHLEKEKIRNVMILRVYYVEGLGHNLLSVGKFYDSNLEVAFRQHTCFIRNLEGVDLLTGYRGNNLYTLSLGDMMVSSPICQLSKASKTKSWLWHQRLSQLNFGTINHLARQGLV